MKGGKTLLTLLDLSNASTLEFRSTGLPLDLLSTPIPSQLTTLELDLVVFEPNSLPEGQRHFLPSLTSLTLLSVAFVGPMRHYFHCPNLVHLHYHIKSEYYTRYNFVKEGKNPYQAFISKTFDEAFFQETSSLESIFLGGTALDKALTLALVSCPLLHSLNMKRSDMERFAHPFLEKLQDPNDLPSLRLLCIDDSWPMQLDMSFAKFVVECGSRRPQMDINGNKKVVDFEEVDDSEHSQSEFDDTDSDSDCN
jgi:hypothetical protein